MSEITIGVINTSNGFSGGRSSCCAYFALTGKDLASVPRHRYIIREHAVEMNALTWICEYIFYNNGGGCGKHVSLVYLTRDQLIKVRKE